MKRLTALLLLFAICLSLVACATKKDASPKVGICVRPDSSVNTDYLKKNLEELGCEVVIYRQNADQKTQTQQIHRLYEEKYALVIVESFTNDAAEGILNSENRKKTSVLFINYNGKVLDGAENVSFISWDPTDMGRTQGKGLDEHPDEGDLNGDGIVCYAVLAGSQDSEDARLQAEGITYELQAQMHLTTIYCGASEDPQSLCDDLLATYGRDLELLICTDSRLSVAAAAAIEKAGRIPGEDLHLIGGGETTELLALIESGDICATAAPTRKDNKNQILEVALAMLNGDSYRNTYTLSYSIFK